MEWNGRHLCPVRRLSCPPPPPAHFSLFPCFRGWWMVARRLGGWFLAVSRFCFDPLSVRSTLIAGAKKRSDCRGKKPNRMHGFGGWMWKYTKIFRGYALGATKVFASPPLLPRKWSCDDSTAQGSPDSRAGAMTAAGQSWRIKVAERERTRRTEQDRKCPLISTIFCWISGQHHRCSTFFASHIYIRIFITTHMLPIPRLVLYFFHYLFFLGTCLPSICQFPFSRASQSAKETGECDQFNEPVAIILQLLLCGLASDLIYR